MDDFSPLAYTAAFVITPQQYFLVFRGKDSPQLSQAESLQRGIKYLKALDNRLSSLIKPGVAMEKQLEINRRANLAMLRDIAKHYDLRVFSCPITENVALLQDFKQDPS